MTSVLGVICYILVGSSNVDNLHVNVVVGAFIMMQMQASTADLLSEARYASKIRLHPEHGPALLGYVWSGMQVGGMMAVVFSGVIISRFGPNAVYLIAALPAATILIPLYFNHLEEQPLTSEAIRKKWEDFTSQGETIVLCIVMLFGTILLTVVGLISEGDASFAASAALGIAVITVLAFSVLLSPTLARFNAFSIIQTSLTLQIGGAS